MIDVIDCDYIVRPSETEESRMPDGSKFQTAEAAAVKRRDTRRLVCAEHREHVATTLASVFWTRWSRLIFFV